MFALSGAFAAQNGATERFTLLSYTWDLPLWVPTLVGVGLVSALMLLHMTTAGIGWHLHRFGIRRELGAHRERITGQREEIARLREQLAAARGDAPAAPATAAAENKRRGWRSWLREPRRMLGRS